MKLFRTIRYTAKSCLIPVLTLLLVLNTSESSSALSSLETGMKAPDFSVSDLHNVKQNFASLKGDKLTVLLFWATWGENSKKALQQMEGLHQASTVT